MNRLSLDREISVAVQAAQQASKLVLEVYSTEFAVDYKQAREPVTLADRRSNDLLVRSLQEAFPQDAILAEESAPRDPEQFARLVASERLWLIDPLDGTKEFVARNGEFAVMIGLAVQGRATLGVVTTPTTGEVWVGIAGDQTYCLAPTGEERACRVSQVNALSEATLVHSRSHRSQTLLAHLGSLGVARQIACGSVGIKCSRVAAAKADVYPYLHAPGGAKVWDGCAPEALVLGAGGTVTDAQGKPIDYCSGQLELTGGFIATNRLLHRAVLDRLSLG